MRVSRVLTSKGLTGYYSDDKAAIINGAKTDVFFYLGDPISPGYRAIRIPGESVSIILILDNGEYVFGDCCSSQYSGSGGRAEPFSATKNIPIIEKHIVNNLEGCDITNFRDMKGLLETIKAKNEIHPSILFGLTQAILAAVAKNKRITMTEVICEEYHLSFPSTRVPIHVQTGDNRYIGVDKAILKKAGAFPQGLINTIEKIGEHGETLLNYARWVVDRIKKFGEPGFNPYIHFDTYGMIGRIFDQDFEKIVQYILKLEETVKPYRLQLEMPIDSKNKYEQIQSFKDLNKLLKNEGSNLILITDEWANNLNDIKDWADSKAADMIHIKPTDMGSLYDIIESVIYCKEKDVHAYLGGSCNETDKAAQITAQIALALRPFQISAKPGMDIDEGIMTVYNEMERTLKLINYRRQLS